MEDRVFFTEQATKGYPVCYSEQCPKKEHCLRWKVGQFMPDTKSIYNCVNPHCKGVGSEGCPQYRCSKKVKMARGMKHIFNSDMPTKVEPFVRNSIISRYCRTYYFEYKRGARVIPPALQQEIRNLFLQIGWKEPIEFDSYEEDYDW